MCFKKTLLRCLCDALNVEVRMSLALETSSLVMPTFVSLHPTLRTEYEDN